MPVRAPGGPRRQPGAEIVAIEAVESIRQVEKHFLDEVPGIRLGSRDSQGEIVHVRPMLFHERVEGPRFTVTYAAE